MLAILPALFLFGVVASITPGPNNIMLMTSGLNFGWRRTLPHMGGVTLGFGVMAALVGLGVAGLFTAVPQLYTVLRWVGAAYLLYLAVKIARSGAVEPGRAGGAPLTFLQAAAFQWINPKAWIIVISACATYAIPGRYAASTLLVALVLCLTTFPSITVWVLFGASLRRLLHRPGLLKAFNYTMAALLAASLYPIFTE